MKPRGSEVNNIIDAVETLSHISDLDVGDQMGIVQRHDIVIQDSELTYRTVHWLTQDDAESVVSMLRDTYRVILDYLRHFYNEHDGVIKEQSDIDGVDAIMSLVGEASKKLDQYTDLFHGIYNSVKTLSEYKELKKFYKEKIFRKTDTGKSWNKLMKVAERSGVISEVSASSVGHKKRADVENTLLDLDAVKHDDDYELLFLHKEDGGRFFDRRLIRNIKLICEFGEEFYGDDPLIGVKEWQEKMLQVTAQVILDSLKNYLEKFYKEYSKFKEMEFAAVVNRSVMALMLSANPRNLLRNAPVKCCYQYYCDFQFFLNQALECRDYRKLLAYPPSNDNQFLCCLMDLVHAMCRGVFVHVQSTQELLGIVKDLLDEGRKLFKISKPKKKAYISEVLSHGFDVINKLLHKHPDGPLFKIFDFILSMDEYRSFDCFTENNYPYKLYDVYIEDKEISHLYLPSPTKQYFIHQAGVLEEFKGLLHAYASDPIEKKHLLINMQDRTSWREYARCRVLEDLQNQAEYAKNLVVVTLPKDTDFYYQLAPYHVLNDAKVFMGQLVEHVCADSTGFHFSNAIGEKLFPKFLAGVAKEIHEVFFFGAKTLSRVERLNFIEIFYLFLELKIFDIVLPDSFSFSCKDGVDIGATSSVLFFSFIKLIHANKLSQEERDLLHAMTFTPALLVRERVIKPERFSRMASALERIEQVSEEYGQDFRRVISDHFARYYEQPIFNLNISIPKIRYQ